MRVSLSTSHISIYIRVRIIFYKYHILYFVLSDFVLCLVFCKEVPFHGRKGEAYYEIKVLLLYYISNIKLVLGQAINAYTVVL